MIIQFSRNIRLLLVLGAGIAIFVAISLTNTPATKLTERVELGVDHKVYSDNATLVRDAKYIVTGTVVDITTSMNSEPIAVSADGTPIPDVPRTHYRVKVSSVEKSAKKVNQFITVSRLGGMVDGVSYEIESWPAIIKGQEAVFFLHMGSDGMYYLLAGGGAIGRKLPQQKQYQLPDTVTTNQDKTISTMELNNE